MTPLGRWNPMKIQKCTVEEDSAPALLNKELIEDENSDNQMTFPELEDRMRQNMTRIL